VYDQRDPPNPTGTQTEFYALPSDAPEEKEEDDPKIHDDTMDMPGSAPGLNGSLPMHDGV
jgi:hypothetical protein